MSSRFPTRPADIDAAWLSEVLGRHVMSFDSERIGASRGNMGEIVRLAFSDGNPPIVAKFSADNEENLAASRQSGLYEREVLFYQHLAPQLDVRVPACHGAFYDNGSGRCLLLLEDLSSETQLDLVEGIGPERTADVLGELAALHDQGMGFHDQAWMQDLRYEGRRDNLRRLIHRGWPRLCETCADIVDPELGAGLGDRLEGLMQRMAELPQTVVHGDVKPDNLQVAGNRIALLDWQAVGYGPPAWDVASAMVNCLTVQDRRAHEQALLGAYPHDLTGYAETLLFSLVVATALTVLGDPNEPRRLRLVRTVAERAIAAMTDHGVL